MLLITIPNIWASLVEDDVSSSFKMTKLLVSLVLVLTAVCCECSFDKKQADSTLELVHVVSRK